MVGNYISRQLSDFNRRKEPTYAHVDLVGIVDHPLEPSEGTDHDDTDWKTIPETTKANVLVDAVHGSTDSFSGLTIGIELADHDIGRVRDDGAEDTGDVTSAERDGGLSALTVVALLARKTVIDHLDDGLEGCELHHGVWDLTTPERVQTLVQTRNCQKSTQCQMFHSPCGSFGGNYLGNTIVRSFGEWRHGRLHADLDSLEWTQRNVGEELGGSRSRKVEPGLVLVRVLGAGEVRIELFEPLVAAVLESTLGLGSISGRFVRLETLY